MHIAYLYGIKKLKNSVYLRRKADTKRYLQVLGNIEFSHTAKAVKQ